MGARRSAKPNWFYWSGLFETGAKSQQKKVIFFFFLMSCSVERWFLDIYVQSKNEARKFKRELKKKKLLSGDNNLFYLLKIMSEHCKTKNSRPTSWNAATPFYYYFLSFLITTIFPQNCWKMSHFLFCRSALGLQTLSSLLAPTRLLWPNFLL